MSAYENVVARKLRLKGKALNVRNGGIKKKKKHREQHFVRSHGISDDNNVIAVGDFTNGTDVHNGGKTGENDRPTPAERRYLGQWQQIELQRIAKAARKSHRIT